MEIRAEGPPCVCRVDSKRTVNGVESNETRYYISSRGPLRAASPLLRNLPYERFAFFGAFDVNPERALKVIRAHWGVENKLHWVLDVEFGEDASRVRKANAAQNLNTLRKFAIDFLRKDKTTNHTFKKKRRIMMWDDTMLPRIIVGR